jgi:hypothetical protein
VPGAAASITSSGTTASTPVGGIPVPESLAKKASSQHTAIAAMPWAR